MNKRNLAVALMLGTVLTNASAQTEVTTGVMNGKDYGVTYLLPYTQIELKVQITKHTYTPGEFCRYAERYLRMTDVQTEAREYWTLNSLQTRIIGLPDKDRVYFVKMKDKTVAPLMELTEDGIVRSINLPFSGKKANRQTTEEQPKEADIDPRNFLTEEILMAGSRAKMAELVAKEIYNIRESKNAMLRGEADNMPTDGAQLKLMLDNLNLQEKALTQMFTGKEATETHTQTLRITPREVTDEVVFRFSTLLGMLEADDLAGEPIYLTIADLHTPDLSAPVEEKKKELEGIMYNVPGRARITLTYQDRRLFDDELPVTQFGTQEYLSPVLFNKKSTTKVLFDTQTGALLKIDREEK